MTYIGAYYVKRYAISKTVKVTKGSLDRKICRNE